MTKERDVTLALKALVTAALPAANVRGFDEDSEKPDVIGEGGCVVGDRGDPGEPDVDLSPLAYNYRHRFELEIAAADGSAGAELDAMLTALGAAVVADRQLGGRCEFLSADAPEYSNQSTDGVASISWATVAIVAEYSTDNPLG